MTDDEHAILAFEERYPRNDRSKEAAARTELGMSWVRYRRALLQLIEREDVIREHPLTVHRVRRATRAAVENRARRSFA